MDLVLTVTFVILHQVTPYFCIPLSEIKHEDNRASSEMYTDIDDLFKHIDTQGLKDALLEHGSLDDKKNVLHMIQLVHKDGSKAPVAIILTPADLAADIANRYDNRNYGNKQDQKYVSKNRQSEMKSGGIPNSLNHEVYETKEEFISQNEMKDEVALEITIPEQPLLNEVAQSTSTTVNNVITKEVTNDATVETELDYEKNNYELVNSSNTGENYQVIDNEEDLYDDTFYENEEKHQNDNDKFIDSDGNQPDIKHEEENIKTDILLNSENEYIAFRNNNSISDEGVVLKEPIISSDIIKLNSNGDVHNIDNKQLELNDVLIEETQVNDTRFPTVYIDDGKIEGINTVCEKERKAQVKERDWKINSRIYNLSFVFSR